MRAAFKTYRAKVHYDKPATNPIDIIINNVCLYYNVTRHQVLFKSKNRTMADIRKVIYKLGRDLTSQSFGEIGRKLNGRTYAAVWHGKVDYEDLMFVDPNVSKEYEKIKTLILPKL